MVRTLIWLGLIVAAVAGLSWLAAQGGYVDAVAFGRKISAPTGVVMGLVGFALAGVAVFTWGVNRLVDLPDRIRRRREAARHARGMVALTRGLEAVAAGDATDAQRHAKAARKQLEEPALTRLLTAQAAQIGGDEETAEHSFSEMLTAPETEFLGLRGLYLQAMRRGDRKAAQSYADRAFRLRPNAGWAFESAYRLAVDRGAWGDARNALDLARRNGLVDADPARRMQAALLSADAYAAEAAGDGDTALAEAEKAVKLAPEFAPGAVIAARRNTQAGKTGKARRLIEAAWAAEPNRALAAAYAELFADEAPEARAERLLKLAEQAPDRDESRILKAEQLVVLRRYDEAAKTLEPVLAGRPTARAFAAMASAAAGLKNDAGAARGWLERAAAAPRDTAPGGDGELHLSTEGWARLVREFGEHARLAPPALDERVETVSGEELRRLLAPPPEPERKPEPESPPQSAEKEKSVSDQKESEAAPPAAQSAAEGEAVAGEAPQPQKDDDAEAAHEAVIRASRSVS